MFAIGVGLFIYDFFRHAPRFETGRRSRKPGAAAAGMQPTWSKHRHARVTACGCRRTREPYYLPAGDEVAIFEQCHARAAGRDAEGPTGCGKTRFVEHMAWRLKRPLVTISCHDDLTASDLIGRFLIRHDGTAWQDGPLTRAVREGAICYLDEVVEARQDTVVVLHSLTDHRRFLPIDKTGETIEAAPGFQLVVSYNPGYQRMLKDLKPSTRQRFVALDFDFPPARAGSGDRRTRSGRRPCDRAWRWCRWGCGCAACATVVWRKCQARDC